MAAANLSVLYGEKEELREVRLLHECFENAVQENKETAKKNGVYFKDEFTSYDDVNKNANIIAFNLSRMLLDRLDTNPEFCIIGVDAEPSPELVMILLAVFKCGAAYLPLDAQLPSIRTKHIVAEAKPVLIVVDEKGMRKLKDTKDVYKDTVVVTVYELLNESLMFTEDKPENKVADSRNCTLAAVPSTSGSTGLPKCIRIGHVAAMNRLQWGWKIFPWQKGEVACWKAQFMSEDHMVEVFSAILMLVPLVIAENGMVGHIEKFINLLEKYKVTRLAFVPSLLMSINSFASLSAIPRLPDVKLFISNSETLTPRLLKDSFNTFKGQRKRFANLYGCTETMADVTWETFDSPEDVEKKSSDGKMSIGRPIQNTNVYIVDEELRIISLGKVGELCVSGLSMADGYVDESRSNAFVPNPHSSDSDHAILYRTGDYCSINEGMIFYHCRKDTQVKIRGNRVDMSEIERAIGNVPGVESVTNLCFTLNERTKIIVAFYTVKSGKAVTNDDVMDACKKALPNYMLPKPILIDQMPLQSTTGKVDREALTKIFEEMRIRKSTPSEVEDLDKLSATILSVISQCLNIPAHLMSLNRSFFEIGGNSVNAVETIVKLLQDGFYISIDEFLHASSIKMLIEKCKLHHGRLQPSIQDGYELIPVKEAKNRTDFVEKFSANFVAKEPMAKILGNTHEEFLPYAESVYALSLRTPSFVVRRRSDNNIVAGDVLCDFLAGEHQALSCHPAMEARVAFLHAAVMDPFKEKLTLEGAGPIMLNCALWVDVTLTAMDNLKLVCLLEEKTIEIAKREGFKSIIVTNTNTVTQNICQYHFGYQLLTEMNPKNFVYKGTKPFSDAPEDYIVKLQIKYL